MKKIHLIIATIFILQSCRSDDKVQLITVDAKYSLSIPSFLTENNELHEEASLQYQNTWRGFYIIVIDESKQEMNEAIESNNLENIYNNDIDGYSSLILDGINQALSNPEQSEIIDTTINNLPAKLVTVKGDIEGFNAFYSIGIYEGKDRYYQVLSWTLSSKEYLHKSKMTRILYSLKELGGTGKSM